MEMKVRGRDLGEDKVEVQVLTSFSSNLDSKGSRMRQAATLPFFPVSFRLSYSSSHDTGISGRGKVSIVYRIVPLTGVTWTPVFRHGTGQIYHLSTAGKCLY